MVNRYWIRRKDLQRYGFTEKEIKSINFETDEFVEIHEIIPSDRKKLYAYLIKSQGTEYYKLEYVEDPSLLKDPHLVRVPTCDITIENDE